MFSLFHKVWRSSVCRENFENSIQPKLQLSLYKPFRSSFKAVYDFADQARVQLLKYYNRCSCGSALQMPDKNRLESPLGVQPAQKASKGVGDIEKGRGVGERGEGTPFPFPSFVLFSLPLSLPFLRLPRRLLGVWTNPEQKTSSAFLPAKQAITVCSSSDFKVKFLHDRSNFDLPKLKYVYRTQFL